MTARREDAALGRLESIATARLDAARALLALASNEPAVLDAVDRAGRGECAADESERALAAHLMVFADHQQSRVFALRARIGLQ